MRYVRFLSLSLARPVCAAAAADDDGDVVTAASRTDDGDSESTTANLDNSELSVESTAQRSVARHSRLSISAAPPPSSTSFSCR